MIPLQRMSRSGRNLGSLLAVVLAATVVRAEGVGTLPARDPSNGERLYGVATLLPTATGLISIGGPALRRLTPGARRWEALHTVAGDNLYRVTADDSGRLLAAWSKEAFIHFIVPAPRQVVSLPKPLAPAGVQNFQISSFEFTPDGRDALIFMSGSVTVSTGQFRGPSASTHVYRIALDGQSAARPIFRLDHGYRLHVSPYGAVFALPKNPGQGCDHNECHIAEIVAYEFTATGVNKKTLFDGRQLQIGRARATRGNDDRRVGLLLEAWTPRRMEVLRWNYGDAKARVTTRPFTGNDRTIYYLTRADALVEFRVNDGLLEIWRQDPGGDQKLANLKELQEVDTGLYAVGERADGTLWWHWGDHIGLLSPGQPPRSHSLAGRLPHRAEWAGVGIHAKSPEQLWIGIDDTGRHYIRVNFSDIDKRLKPWPAGALVERVRGESVGHAVKDSSTSDRLNNAVTLRQMKGGLFSMGGPTLRRLVTSARNWEILHVVPKDSLYRVVADDDGRLLAAWEKDPNLHLFSPAERLHVTMPKPGTGEPALDSFQVDHLEFLPGGRDALVVMHAQKKAPPPRHVPEPVRFYYSTWATLAYRVPLDGKSAPRLLYRENYAQHLFTSKRGSVFGLPKYDGQDCSEQSCLPMTAIIAYEITDTGAIKRTLLEGNAGGANLYLSGATPVRGSNDERLALVVRFTRNSGKQWLNGPRALLRWRWGDAKSDYRPLPGNSPHTPKWLLTRNNDFIELMENWDAEPDQLEIRRYLAGGGEQSTTITALTKMSSPHGFGERENGGLWLHWGDHLGVFSPGAPPKSFDMDRLVQRGTEWAGAATYVSNPESVWVGLDGRGRGYVRVDLGEVEKRGKVWR